MKDSEKKAEKEITYTEQDGDDGDFLNEIDLEDE